VAGLWKSTLLSRLDGSITGKAGGWSLEPACEHLGRKAVSGGQGGGGADENKEGRGGNMSLKIFM